MKYLNVKKKKTEILIKTNTISKYSSRVHELNYERLWGKKNIYFPPPSPLSLFSFNSQIRRGNEETLRISRLQLRLVERIFTVNFTQDEKQTKQHVSHIEHVS